MPCFVCSDYHISTIAMALNAGDDEAAQRTAVELFNQNVTAYNSEHPDTPYEGDFQYQEVGLDKVGSYQLIKAIDSFAHQALSDPEFENSDLNHRLTTLRVNLALEISNTTLLAAVVNPVRATTEYEEAEWFLKAAGESITDSHISANAKSPDKKR